MPTVEDCLAYLGIDYADDLVRKNVTRALATAVKVLHGAVGEDVETLMPNDSRAKELALIYMDDLYSEKGVSAKVSGATRRMVADMEMQLRLELRTLREEAGA
jgi:Asp-tRNA(Asn)/Glu-tRNA(Gln) amidotransferase A subunit family amidase